MGAQRFSPLHLQSVPSDICSVEGPHHRHIRSQTRVPKTGFWPGLNHPLTS